jgi:hypothetical protein
MARLSDGQELAAIILCVVFGVCVVIFLILSAQRLSNNSTIRQWREDKASIVINNTPINPEDITSYSHNNGVIEIKTKTGQTIESSDWTVITPAPAVEK